MGKLSASEICALRKRPGKHYDGDGLLLQVIAPTRAAWCFRYQRQGKERTISLGSADLFSLAEARERALACRKQLADGIDPLGARRGAGQIAEEVARARARTFSEAAEAYIAAHESEWRNPKHRQQWRNTLATYAAPIIGTRPCADVTTDDIQAVLDPIWTKKRETAARLRGRIEVVLDYAKSRKWCDGPNPAVWRGNLKMRLVAHHRSRTVKHHAALDWREAATFMRELRERDAFGARALEFAILTAARSGEVRGARWTEVDLDAATWTISADRMKSRREHRIPLSKPALEILSMMAKLKDGSRLVFIGQKRGVEISDMTLGAVLRRMGRADLTAHGFRSTFRDWAAEATNYPNHVVELALAHAIGSKVEAAYRRGDLFEKRKALMADWAAFIARPPAQVVQHPRAVSRAPDTAEASA